MEGNKEQTLTKLYSLRAGISAVATQRNKVEEIHNNAKSKEADLNRENDTLYGKRNENYRELNGLNEELKKSEKEYQEYKEKYKKLKKPSKEWTDELISRDTKFYVGLPLGAIIISLIYILLFPFVIKPKVYEAVTAGLTDFVYFLVWLLMIVFCAGCFLGICFLIWALSSKIPDIKRERYRIYDSLLKNYNERNNRLNSSSEKIEQLNSKIKACKNKINENTKQIESNKSEIVQLESIAETKSKPYYQIGAMIQEQFENEFNSFLNLRDWKNIDIIIFAYESGRVDTMREALTFADAESRTDRIVAAINDSSQAVCRSIQSGLKNLALSMGECFSVISRQIAEQTNKLDKISVNLENLSDNMENLSENTANIAINTVKYSNNIAKLAAKVDYSNALQEQRNKSSAELVEKNNTFMLEARNYMHDIYNDRYN